MNKSTEFRIEMLSLLKAKQFPLLQKNELKRTINNIELTDSVLANHSPTSYLNHLLKSYGKNYYTPKIIINSIANFFIILLAGSFFKWVKVQPEFVEISTEFLLINAILTCLFYPFLQLFIRNALIFNKKGIKIVKQVLIVLIIIGGSTWGLFQLPFINAPLIMGYNRFVVLVFGTVLLLFKLLAMKYYRFELIQKSEE